MVDLHAILSAVEPLIRQAGKRIADTTASPIHEKSGHYNFVTDTDVAVQEFLKTELVKLIPGCCFFAEEQENETMTDEYTWVVDPVDGTCNFTRHRHASCVSIALMHQQKPVLGVVFQPYLNELYTAIAGEGAFLNGRPIHVSDTPFNEALVDMGTAPYYAEFAAAVAFCIHEFIVKAGDIRRVGSAALDCCNLASGRSDIFFELLLSPWDFAAAALLIQEAGGVFMMPYNDRIDYSKPACILAANPTCIDQARDIVMAAKEYIKK